MSTKICPICKTTNPIEANFCRHCRYEFLGVHRKSPKGYCDNEKAKVIGSLIGSLLNLRIKNALYLQGDLKNNINERVFRKDGSSVFLNGTAISFVDNSVKLDYIKQRIDNLYKSCQTGAITDTDGVVIFDAYGYAHTKGISNVLADKLEYANRHRHYIHDITISNSGKYWCVVYGDSDYKSVAPVSFNKKLEEYLAAGEKIISVALNDAGDFAIITKKHCFFSSQEISNAFKEACKNYGFVYSVSLSNKGYIICAEKGIYFRNIPTSVYKMINSAASKIKIKFVKFTDSGTCLITDGVSKYEYRI